jgi:hypothetical protein
MRDPFPPRQRKSTGTLVRLLYIERLHECGNATVSSITYGRGLSEARGSEWSGDHVDARYALQSWSTIMG